jgi:hypothetical protein
VSKRVNRVSLVLDLETKGRKLQNINIPIDTNDTLFFSSRSFVSATACVRIGRESITAENRLEDNFSFIWSFRLDISPIYEI